MNLNETPQRIRWATFVILAGTAILFTILDSTGNLDLAFDFIRDPIATVLNWTSTRADTLSDVVSGPRDLQAAREENVRLRARIDELERELEEQRESLGEYQLLLDIFNQARQNPDLRRLTAFVIGRDPNPTMRSIIIDKGSEDGVRVGMPVESARGFVGQVFRTTNHSAQVVLVTDNSSSVPARLSNSRAVGILHGGGLGGAVSLDWIDLKYQVEVGEVVLTSGLGGEFPQDIVIGRVIEVERREAELFQRATIQPAVDFEALEIVSIITDFQPVDVEIFSSNPPDN